MLSFLIFNFLPVNDHDAANDFDRELERDDDSTLCFDIDHDRDIDTELAVRIHDFIFVLLLPTFITAAFILSLSLFSFVIVLSFRMQCSFPILFVYLRMMPFVIYILVSLLYMSECTTMIAGILFCCNRFSLLLHSYLICPHF